MYSFICPVCRSSLELTGQSLKCSNGHCYDLSKSGYVNLLMSSSQGRHGDDKAMVRARTHFLDKGYYAPLSKEVVSLCKKVNPHTVLDAGCGEGYYTSAVCEALPASCIVGTDISKNSVNAAVKRCHNASFAVAGSSSLPLSDNCVDLIITIFAPVFDNEFSRVLNDTGHLLRVSPMEKHLHGLRKAVYDNAYDNDPVSFDIPGFILEEHRELHYTIHLDNNEDIISLFMMTPYYYKTSRDDQAKLKLLSHLETEIAFSVDLFQKNIIDNSTGS